MRFARAHLTIHKSYQNDYINVERLKNAAVKVFIRLHAGLPLHSQQSQSDS